MRNRILIPGLLIGAALGLCACDDAGLETPELVVPETEVASASKTERGITLQTRFEIVGAQELSHAVEIERLYVNVGAIFLDPIEDEESAASFASRLPVELDFAPVDGVDSLLGPELVLPFGGDFAVSVQIEPTFDYHDNGPKAREDDTSILVQGLWAPNAGADYDYERPRFDPEDRVEEPWPLPVQPKDRVDAANTTLPFSYRSDAVVRFQVAELELDEEGVYELVLTMHVKDWMEEAVIPALETAAEQRRRQQIDRFTDEELVFEDPLETVGVDLDGLIGDFGVNMSRR